MLLSAYTARHFLLLKLTFNLLMCGHSAGKRLLPEGLNTATIKVRLSLGFLNLQRDWMVLGTVLGADTKRFSKAIAGAILDAIPKNASDEVKYSLGVPDVICARLSSRGVLLTACENRGGLAQRDSTRRGCRRCVECSKGQTSFWAAKA